MLFDETNWLAYRETNLLFAEALRKEVKSGDMVWVQDYHLMLLPMMLRSLIEAPASHSESTLQDFKDIRNGLAMSDARQRDLQLGGKSQAGGEPITGVKIGFFLHTPFPSSEIYRILPVRKEILIGVLHCDLIGFHTYDYARHFLSSCARVLGLSTMPNGAGDCPSWVARLRLKTSYSLLQASSLMGDMRTLAPSLSVLTRSNSSM